jgi:hypothetical protein
MTKIPRSKASLPLILSIFLASHSRDAAATDPASCDCSNSQGSCAVGGQILNSTVVPTPWQECGHSCAPFKMNWTLRITVSPPAQCAAVSVATVVSTPGTAQGLNSQALNGIYSVYRRIVTDGQLDVPDWQVATAASPNSNVKYAGVYNSCHVCPLKTPPDDSGSNAAAAAAAAYNASQGVTTPIMPSVGETPGPSCFQGVLAQVNAISARYKNTGGSLCSNYKAQAEMNNQIAGVAASCSDANSIQLATQSRASAAQANKAAAQICAH